MVYVILICTLTNTSNFINQQSVLVDFLPTIHLMYFIHILKANSTELRKHP